LEKFIEKFKSTAAAAGLTADIYAEKLYKSEVAANDGEIDRVQESDTFGAAVRVFKDGKMGFAYTSSPDPDAVVPIIEKARASMFVDGYSGLDFRPFSGENSIKMKDPGFEEATLEKKKARALSVEGAAKAESTKVKYVRDTTCVDMLSRTAYFNTAGARYDYEKTYSYMFTSAVASDGTSDEAADAMDGGAIWSKLDPVELGRQAGGRAASLLSGGPVKTGEYSLIIPSYAAVEFLQVISPMFSAANLRKGKTLLAAIKEGETIASAAVNLIDDPCMDYGAGSYPADAEGFEGKTKKLIDAGKFTGFIYDMKETAFYKKSASGNSARISYKSLPEPGVSNFYMAPGAEKTTEILKKEKGIFVNSMMGLHMTDTVSGNFSLGINGWVFESGEKKGAVKEVLITGNIRDFLKNISAAGDDMKFYMNFGSPTLFVKGITVAGK
jgi:PmbA protein